MKKTWMFILVSLLLIVGTACSQDEITNEYEEDIEQEQQIEDEKDDPVEETNEDAATNDKTDLNEKQETEKENSDKNKENVQTDDESKKEVVETLKEIDLIGLNIDEVKQLLGGPTVEAKDAVLHVYRYDFPINNYVFDNQLNAVDVEGLYSGNMELQIMVFFENAEVASYSIYHLKEDEIMHYRETPAGADEYSASRD